MLTALGKFLRKLRIDRGEYLKDMAEKLDVTVSFLSAVENGKKKMPSSWNRLICDLYKLNKSQIDEFTKAIADSEDKMELVLKDVNEENKRIAISFARKFSDFDGRQREIIMKILEDD